MYYKLIRENSTSSSSRVSSKAVPGKLYRVSHYTNKRTGVLVERLRLICPTLENADKMVPALIYRVAVTNSPRFKRLLPVLCQVPNRSGIRFIGVHKNFNFWGERRTQETYRCDEVASQSEGFERDDEHSKGCILVSAENEQVLTELWLKEQQNHEETRIEFCQR